MHPRPDYTAALIVFCGFAIPCGGYLLGEALCRIAGGLLGRKEANEDKQD